MTVQDEFWAAVNWLKTLPDPRAKLLASQAALVGDLREALKAQDEELDLLRKEHDSLRAGLKAAAAALYAAQESVLAAMPVDARNLFARLNGGHENIMAYVHGDPDYLTRGGLSTRHVDCQPERKPKRRAAQ